MTNIITDWCSLFNGDCLSVLSQIDSNSVQLCLCDLPYGVLNRDNASWDIPIDLNCLWDHFTRIGKENCAFVFFSSGIFTHDLIESNRNMFKYTLVWDKKRTTGFLNANKQPLRQHEDIVVFYNYQCIFNPQFSVGQPSHQRGLFSKDSNNVYGGFKNAIDKEYGINKYPTSILTFEKNNHVLHHPSEKPVSILEYLIKTYSNEGDIVLDPTMGSGSCGEACKRTNRRFKGIELNDEWFSFAKKRLGFWDD